MRGQTFRVTLEATGEAPTLPGLRQLLKRLGRAFALRLVEERPVSVTGAGLNWKTARLGTVRGLKRARPQNEVFSTGARWRRGSGRQRPLVASSGRGSRNPLLDGNRVQSAIEIKGRVPRVREAPEDIGAPHVDDEAVAAGS